MLVENSFKNAKIMKIEVLYRVLSDFSLYPLETIFVLITYPVQKTDLYLDPKMSP